MHFFPHARYKNQTLMMSVRLDITNMRTSLATTPKICCLKFCEGHPIKKLAQTKGGLKGRGAKTTCFKS